MRPLLGLAFCCALAAQTPEAAKATISNIGSEPAPYVPADTTKPVDDYSRAFINRPVTMIVQPPVIEQTVVLVPTWLTTLQFIGGFTPVGRFRVPARTMHHSRR